MATDNGIYPYKPNGPVCIVMALLFGISAGYHLFQMIRKKTWFYTPLVVGAISELAQIMLGIPQRELH